MWIFLCLFTKKLNKYNHLCVSARVVTCWRTHHVVSSTLLLVCPCVIASAGVPVAWGGYGVPAHPRPVPANQVLMCGGNRRRAAWQMAGWPGKPAPFSGFSSRQMTGIYFITLKTGEGHAHTHKHTHTNTHFHHPSESLTSRWVISCYFAIYFHVCELLNSQSQAAEILKMCLFEADSLNTSTETHTHTNTHTHIYLRLQPAM